MPTAATARDESSIVSPAERSNRLSASAEDDDGAVNGDVERLALGEMPGREPADGQDAGALGRSVARIPSADEFVAMHAHGDVGAVVGKQVLARVREPDSASGPIRCRNALRCHRG